MATQPPEVSDNNDNADFDAEFARLAAERDGTAPRQEPPASDDAPPEGNAPVDDEPAPTTAPAKSTEDGTSGQPPEGDGSQPPPEEKASDPWAGVPDEIRERIVAIEKERDEAKHKAKSDAERVAALSRKIASLSTPAPKAKEETKAEPTEAQKALDDKIKVLKEDYPEVADPIIEMLNAQREELGKVTQKLETVEGDRQAAYIDQQRQLLETMHPDWSDVAATPEFAAWMEGQPTGIQNLAASYDARETATVLSLYKTEQGEAAKAAASPALTPAQTATEARRREQLEGGKEVRSRPAQAASGPPDDYDGAVAYYAAKKDAELAAARRK